VLSSQGKSFILNQLLQTTGGFQIGSTTRPCTKGLWMWSTPQRKLDELGKEYHIVSRAGCRSSSSSQVHLLPHPHLSRCMMVATAAVATAARHISYTLALTPVTTHDGSGRSSCISMSCCTVGYEQACSHASAAACRYQQQRGLALCSRLSCRCCWIQRALMHTIRCDLLLTLIVGCLEQPTDASLY
jgi:hypothetical protein